MASPRRTSPSRGTRDKLGVFGLTVTSSLLAGVLGVHASSPECSASIPPVLQHPYLSGVCSLPVDDSVGTQPTSYSPWTHVPLCSSAAGDPKKKYCVFTNSRQGKRGLSILARPEVAADSADVLNKYLNVTQGDAEPFAIVDIPGKGKGVVATRRIKRYENIMVDYSVLLVDTMFAFEVPAAKGYRLLHSAVEQLSDPDSVRSLEQSNNMARDPVENVLRTNAFHTMLGEQPHMALYPIVSRINHACKPNSYTRFNPDSLQVVSVAAVRDIEPGEEITISYIVLGQTTAQRKKTLETWGFECKCDLCTASEAERAASDARREQIARLSEQATEAFEAGRSYQALRITRQVINLLPSEELYTRYAEEYENMARIYFGLRDHENAVKYAKMSLYTLVQQGYVDRITQEQFEVMWSRFVAEEINLKLSKSKAENDSDV